MFALAGIIGLMISIYMRPYEWNADLSKLPFLQVCCLVAVIGFVIDLGIRRTRLISNPMTPFCVFLAFWCLITLAIAAPDLVATKWSPIFIALTLFFLISHGVQTVKAFTRLVLTIFALGLFVAYVGADQGLSDYGCHITPPKDDPRRAFYDGRSCQAMGDMKQEEAVTLCYQGPGAKNVTYGCEKPGMFNTSSIEGRVRYLGVLTDPNELALATSLALPIAFAFFEMKRSLTRLLLLLFGVGLVALEVVFTKSRGGQIVFAVVLGAYFVRKYGIRRGAIIAGVMVVPLVILGGRSGDSAEQSSLDRLQAAGAAIHLLIQYPIRGGGYTQFTEHHPLTAHNAYLLAAGELGWPGLLTFASIIYLCLKTTVSVLRFEFDEDDFEAANIKSLAMAMLAVFAGIAIGVFLLSWTYHFILWIHFGLAGSLYAVMKKKYPSFQVRFSWKEFGAIFVAWIFILTAFTVHIIRKNCW
jgi:O-antigen ligase/polysaccharide polymerase Wzy-like membrane protein